MADLSLTTWKLRAMNIAGVGDVAIPAGDPFTIMAATDSRVAIQADCNRCTGLYSLTGSTLDIGLLACTRAYCTATVPADTQFVGVLQGDHVARIDGASLVLQSSRGTLRFAR